MVRGPVLQVRGRRPVGSVEGRLGQGGPAVPPARRPRNPLDRPGRRMAVMAGVAAVALAVDQLTTSLAERYLAAGPVHLWGSFSLTLTYNRGAAFSLAQGLTGWLIVVGVVLVAVLLLVSRRLPSHAAAVAVGLMLGGAVGNLSDRLFRGNHGAVVDFIASRYWPTFNMADVAIVAGALLLVVAGYRRERLACGHHRAQDGGSGDGPGSAR